MRMARGGGGVEEGRGDGEEGQEDEHDGGMTRLGRQ